MTKQITEKKLVEEVLWLQNFLNKGKMKEFKNAVYCLNLQVNGGKL